MLAKLAFYILYIHTTQASKMFCRSIEYDVLKRKAYKFYRHLPK